MKVGDLVYDSGFGMNGIIIGMITHHNIGTWAWEVLYQGGHTDEAYNDELEVISESR
jgi:hypothetical protein